MAPPSKYAKQKTQYVGEGQSLDPAALGYANADDPAYRQAVLDRRGKNFSAVGGQATDEWRLLEEAGTGRRYYRHYDAQKKQYDPDLFDATDQNAPADVARRAPPVVTPGTYNEGEQVAVAANPFAAGTTAAAVWARQQQQHALDVRAQHYRPVVGTAAQDDPQSQQEWRALQNNDTGYYQNRHLNTGTGQYDLSLGKAYNAGGVVGGAGNRVAGKSADNSWDVAADGSDVRTADQKYYDRNFKGFSETADALGHYSWYGTGDTDAQNVNLDTVQDPSKPAPTSKDRYWDYNGAPDQAWFSDQVRNRANKSIYGRTR